MNLKAKIYLYVNSSTQRCPNKIIKTFLIKDFFHLPPVSLTLVVCLELRIYLQIKKKNWKGPNAILRCWGKVKSKISWPCPFKAVGFCRLPLKLLCTRRTVAPLSHIHNTTTTPTSSLLQIPSDDKHIELDNDMYVDFGSFWIFCRKPPAYCTCRNKEIILKMPVLQIQLKVSLQSLFIHILRESHACNLLVWKTFLLLQIILEKFLYDERERSKALWEKCDIL